MDYYKGFIYLFYKLP